MQDDPPTSRHAAAWPVVRDCDSSLDGCLLDAALEGIPAAAFLVTADGVLRNANAMGQALFERERPALCMAIAEGQRVASQRFEVTRIVRVGSPDHYLVVMRVRFAHHAVRLPKAASLWGLTLRQTEVLSLLARGLGNKSIAATLECRERTVEVHVSALLEKAECESRAELIAQYWTSV